MGDAEDRERLRTDLVAGIGARQELGAMYEPALVESFLDRIETAVDQRVASELALKEKQGQSGYPTELAFASIAMGIPASAIGAVFAELPGLAVTWMGIVGVNMVVAWVKRPRRSR